MAKDVYTAREAAQALGISLDTLRRWDRDGRIRTRRDSANRRVVSAREIARLRGDDGSRHVSARNRLRGTVREVRVDGLLAQVEILVTEPARVVAIVTRGVKLVVAAPGVPVGDYTRIVLHNLNLDDALQNVVSNESDVRGVLAKVALGEADAGFVYTTDARSVRGKVATIGIRWSAQPI